MVSVPFVDLYPWDRRPNSVHIDSFQTGFITASFANVLYFVIDCLFWDQSFWEETCMMGFKRIAKELLERSF